MIVSTIEESRDELIAALEKIAAWDRLGKEPHSYTRDDVRKIASDALANARKVSGNISASELLDEDNPVVICLCGSTRFGQAFHEAGWFFTLEGMIVLSIASRQ